MTDSRVTTLRYEQTRPFHPGRLGTVLRSAGFCRLATHLGILARWIQIGSAIWIDPLTAELEAATTAQDLAFSTSTTTGFTTVWTPLPWLTAGPNAWLRFDDLLPSWLVNFEDCGDRPQRSRARDAGRTAGVIGDVSSPRAAGAPLNAWYTHSQ